MRPLDGDSERLPIERVVEPLAKSGPLEHDGGNHEVQSHSAVAVAL